MERGFAQIKLIYTDDFQGKSNGVFQHIGGLFGIGEDNND